MENQQELYKALQEVSVVLEYTDPILVTKVPKNFIWFMNNFKDETHYFQVDLNKPLQEQKLMYESIVILSIILKTSWCDKKTIKRLKKTYRVQEETFMEDRRKQTEYINNEIQSLKVRKKEGFFKRVFTKIKSFFGSNKNRLYLSD